MQGGHREVGEEATARPEIGDAGDMDDRGSGGQRQKVQPSSAASAFPRAPHS